MDRCKDMHMYAYIHIYACICICIIVYIHIYIYIHTHTQLYTCASIGTYPLPLVKASWSFTGACLGPRPTCTRSVPVPLQALFDLHGLRIPECC